MSFEDWKKVLPSLIDEKISFIIHESTILKGSFGEEFKGSIILTDKRLFILKENYSGLITKKFSGYDSIEYEIPLDKISLFVYSSKGSSLRLSTARARAITERSKRFMLDEKNAYLPLIICNHKHLQKF